MHTFRFSAQAGPRLLVAFGTAALLTGIGLTAVRPVHSAGGPIPVTISNTPLPTTAADDHDKQGVQETTQYVLEVGDFLVSKPVYTVPAHKRLVIDTVSANAFQDNRFSVACVTHGGATGGSASTTFSILPDGSPLPAGNVRTHLYADAGTSVDIQIGRSVITRVSVLSVTFTGHLVDMP